jgi:hypothetical protein
MITVVAATAAQCNVPIDMLHVPLNRRRHAARDA